MTGLRLDLLGGLVIRPSADAVAPLASRKAAALFGLLALRPGRPQSRERLAGLLWERAAEEQARASLRQALATLRRSVPGVTAALDAGGEMVALRAGTVSTDVAEFEAAAALGTPAALARAAELYRGDLLDGLRPGSLAFEAWLLPERERLRARAVAAMRILLDQAPGQGTAAETQIALALRLLALEPSQEEVHRALMRLHARLGRHGDALRQYDACRAALRRELDMAPDAETERLYREIRERRQASAPARAGVPASRGAGTPRDTGPPASRPVTMAPAEVSVATQPFREFPDPRRADRAALFAAVRDAAARFGEATQAAPGTSAAVVFRTLTARVDTTWRGVHVDLQVHAAPDIWGGLDTGAAGGAHIGAAVGTLAEGQVALDGRSEPRLREAAPRIAARSRPGDMILADAGRSGIGRHTVEGVAREASSEDAPAARPVGRVRNLSPANHGGRLPGLPSPSPRPGPIGTLVARSGSEPGDLNPDATPMGGVDRDDLRQGLCDLLRALLGMAAAGDIGTYWLAASGGDSGQDAEPPHPAVCNGAWPPAKGMAVRDAAARRPRPVRRPGAR